MSSAYFSTVTGNIDLNAGRSIAGLDVNGDGNGDLVIGADFGINGADEATGRVVVIYGSGSANQFPDATFDLDAAGLTDGTDGFYISGTDESELGWDLLNAGDQNGDGNDDLAMVSRADGTITVLFGGTSPTADIDLAAGIGAAGYTITGLPILADDFTVSGGTDVNGGGIADLIIGVSGGIGTDSVHVVFGDASSADVDITALNGTTGFTVTGLELINTDGFNVGTVGDLNNDGIDDILLGRFGPDEDGIDSGDIVVMLGTSTVQSASFDIDDLAPTETVIFTGLTAAEAASASVAGNFDINGDSIDDLVVGASAEGTSGAVYVVFGDGGIADTVDLNALDGTDGFMIEGLTAGDQLGLVVQSLGDVSGDGRDDLGVMTASGDLYVIYGIEAAASFSATYNLGALNGANGFAITGLFSSTPESLSLAGLPSINNDDINDIAIGATFVGGTVGETFVILGGDENFDALDDADDGVVDGLGDGTIAFDQLGDVTFAQTDTSIVIGGDTTGELDEDGPDVSGAISISDENDLNTTFENSQVFGVYGVLTVDGGGGLWTYALNTDVTTVALLDALGDGDEFVDTLIVPSSEPTASQTITITIAGVDDEAVFRSDPAVPSFSEDISQFTSIFSLTDVDNDDPSLAGQRFDGVNGYVQFNDAGDAYTFFQTNPLLQDQLDGGESATETITITDTAGNEFGFTVTFTGTDEGAALVFDGGDNDIFTSFGDDFIQALGGNDNINPGGGDDRVEAGDGNDTVLDGMGNDIVDGGADNDKITLLTGENTVDGGTGSDFILTGYKNDDIMGGAGNDVISADSNAFFLFGNDRIEGGAGDDLMSGGSGADTFVFNINDGRDTIAQFNEDNVGGGGATDYIGAPTAADFESGIDKIELNGFTGLNADNIFDAISDNGNSAEFTADGTTIVFFNLTESQLSVDDFIFIA